MRSTVIMKLSDWLLGTYDGVACTSGWLCSCLLSLGVFWLIFSDSWCRNHYFICCFLMFDHEIALIWCCDYFRATIYCAALPPTVILFVVLITTLLSLPFCFYFRTFRFAYVIPFSILEFSLSFTGRIFLSGFYSSSIGHIFLSGLLSRTVL